MTCSNPAHNCQSLRDPIRANDSCEPDYCICYIRAFIVAATLRAVVTTVPYGSSSLPIVTCGLRNDMRLSFGSLAEKWNSLAPEILAI